jgi:hypothetical protein
VQIASLTQELQKVAQAAGFHHPLMIAIEQENGMVSDMCADAAALCATVEQLIT